MSGRSAAHSEGDDPYLALVVRSYEWSSRVPLASSIAGSRYEYHLVQSCCICRVACAWHGAPDSYHFLPRSILRTSESPHHTGPQGWLGMTPWPLAAHPPQASVKVTGQQILECWGGRLSFPNPSLASRLRRLQHRHSLSSQGERMGRPRLERSAPR
eukprot:scaffold347_cov380-Prasinococcus_capsulatus_cf.AAC.12